MTLPTTTSTPVGIAHRLVLAISSAHLTIAALIIAADNEVLGRLGVVRKTGLADRLHGILSLFQTCAVGRAELLNGFDRPVGLQNPADEAQIAVRFKITKARQL
jgi:hypothetical protein